MFEPAPAGISGGVWSDRHGIVGRHPTLGPSGGHSDPGDLASHRAVAEHDPQISSFGRGGAEVQGSRAVQWSGPLRGAQTPVNSRRPSPERYGTHVVHAFDVSDQMDTGTRIPR